MLKKKNSYTIESREKKILTQSRSPIPPTPPFLNSQMVDP